MTRITCVVFIIIVVGGERRKLRNQHTNPFFLKAIIPSRALQIAAHLEAENLRETRVKIVLILFFVVNEFTIRNEFLAIPCCLIP